MAKPSRPSSAQDATGTSRTFFLTTKTAQSKRIFQTGRMANLLIDVFRVHVSADKFTIHDFVVMPDHVHILLTVPGNLSIEKAMQLIKGVFSFRARKEFGFQGEIWQRGFSDVRITDEESFHRHRTYIEMNPVRSGLVSAPAEFPTDPPF